MHVRTSTLYNVQTRVSIPHKCIISVICIYEELIHHLDGMFNDVIDMYLHLQFEKNVLMYIFTRYFGPPAQNCTFYLRHFRVVVKKKC